MSYVPAAEGMPKYFIPMLRDVDRRERYREAIRAAVQTFRQAEYDGGPGPGPTVVDVGANFGWYTLLSLALGCAVVAVEPVPAWREVRTLGVALNQGFASRLTLVAAVAYPERGTFTVWAPDPRSASKVNGSRPPILTPNPDPQS